MNKLEIKEHIARIEANTQKGYRLNPEACKRENVIAKSASKDCYPERDKDCTDERAKLLFIRRGGFYGSKSR